MRINGNFNNFQVKHTNNKPAFQGSVAREGQCSQAISNAIHSFEKSTSKKANVVMLSGPKGQTFYTVGIKPVVIKHAQTAEQATKVLDSFKGLFA